MTGPWRNDPRHGDVSRRRKIVNQRLGLDRYEERTREVITQVFAEFDAILAADAARRARREVAMLEGWVAGEPSE